MAATGKYSLAARFSKQTKAPAAASRSKTTKKRAQKRTQKPYKRPVSTGLHPKIQAAIKPLWPHQEVSKEVLGKLPRHLDLSDPGTAKTRVQLELFAERRRKGSRAALVVAPKTLLRPAWANDAHQFVPDMICSLAYAHNRAEAFEADADIYITNTDAATWLAKQPKKFFAKFDTLIIDELIAFANRNSGRSKALASIVKYFDHRAGLNGTLTDGKVEQAWHQVFLIDDGKTLGSNFYRFRSATHEADEVRVSNTKTVLSWKEKEGAIEAVAGLLKDISIRHRFENVMKDVPRNKTRTITYSPPDKLLKLYKKMQDDAILQLQNTDAVAVNAAVLRGKLLQIASGAVYGQDGQYEVLDSERYELVAALASEVKHSIIFFNWGHQKEEMFARLEQAGLSTALIDGSVKQQDRDRIVNEYQAGAYRTLLLHPQTGAHGLTLTRGTRSIWCSPIDRPGFLKQGAHRIFRGGQTQATENIMVLAEGTLEPKVYEKFGEKNSRMLRLLELLETQ